VAYFGVMPIEMSSGVDRDGQPRGSRRHVRSRRGNDLVRRYLWMAALSAVRCNPAVKALYRRVVAQHPDHKAIAIGHAMRKLLHLAFALWQSDKPFDEGHYPWDRPTHDAPANESASQQAPEQQTSASQTAGHKPETKPAQKVVTAVCAASVAGEDAGSEGIFIDFAHLKRQLPLAQVLAHLGLSARLRGSGAQRRCACPLHRGDARGRSFSVNLEENVFCCFDKRCGKHGDVIDLWAELRHVSLREAAIDLVATFGLEPAAKSGTEKRDG
jgi:hypothetical protein